MPVIKSQQFVPLTSRRLVAAMMIFLYHAPAHLTWLEITWVPSASLQSVSFFFVLSGFILTQAYINRPNVT